MSGSLSYDDMYAMIYKKNRVTKIFINKSNTPTENTKIIQVLNILQKNTETDHLDRTLSRKMSKIHLDRTLT